MLKYLKTRKKLTLLPRFEVLAMFWLRSGRLQNISNPALNVPLVSTSLLTGLKTRTICRKQSKYFYLGVEVSQIRAVRWVLPLPGGEKSFPSSLLLFHRCHYLFSSPVFSTIGDQIYINCKESFKNSTKEAIDIDSRVRIWALSRACSL